MPKNRLLNSAGIGSAALLAGLPVFLTLGPVVNPQGAFADNVYPAEGSGGARARVSAAMSITAENIDITATPTIGNTFITTTSKVKVTNTSSTGGYHLTMSSQNGGSLKYGTSDEIGTFSDYSKTGTAMKEGSSSSWGYTLQPVIGTNGTQAENEADDLAKTYYPIPTAGTNWNLTADEGSTQYAYLANTTKYSDRVNGDEVTVGFAFAIGPDATAGDYTDTIVYTAVPNPDNNTLFDMTTMQDLAEYKTACSKTPKPAANATVDTTTLIAGTDKIPTVTLRDSRNDETYTVKKLADGNCWMTSDLKIAGVTLKADSSNVTTEVTLPAATASSGTSNTYTAAKIANDGWDDAAGTTKTTYLYNWFAAIAATPGTNLETDANYGAGKTAPQDICPKGWHLPDNDGNTSWQKLLRQGQGVYEIATSSNGYAAGAGNWGSYAKIKNPSDNPLGLHTTGLFDGGGLGGTGSGYYWSRTAYSGTVAYTLDFYSSGVYPQGDNYKQYGFAVRCVSE